MKKTVMSRLYIKKAATEDLREKLFDHADELFKRALSKTQSRECAEDLVQETFLSALKALDRFQNKSHIKTWLFSILNNKINEYFRKEIRIHRLIDSDARNTMTNTVLTSPLKLKSKWDFHKGPPYWNNHQNTHLLDDPDFRKAMYNCLQDLPEKSFAVIHYKYLVEEKHTRINQKLGISKANFWQLLHRAKVMLKECLEHFWFKQQ